MAADRPAPESPAPPRAWPRLGSLLLFAVVAAALLAAIAEIRGTLAAGQRERAQAARTDAVLAAINDVARATLNAETGQRGYLITLDRRYRAAYELGAARYPLAIARLERLTARAARRDRQLVGEVRRLAGAKFAEMAGSVALVEQGRVLDAEVALLGDDGQRTMERLRGALAELEARQRRALRAQAAQTAALEARLRPLLIGLLALIVGALALGLWLLVRAVRAEAVVAQSDALRAARDRADLLARELNHRVKNLFAVVLAIVRMSGKGDPGAAPAVTRIDQRIRALAAAHGATKGDVDSARVDLRTLVETVIAPYRSKDASCEIEGEAVSLPGKVGAPLGLVLHELATNAVKYGAWAAPGGTVAVRWRREPGRVRLSWRESGGGPVAPPTQTGFGSQLIDSSARQLGGSVDRAWHGDGLELRLDLPTKR